MDTLTLSLTVPYWLPSQEMVAWWCVGVVFELALLILNATLFELRMMDAVAVFREAGDGYYRHWSHPAKQPPRLTLASVIWGFALWPIGIVRQIKTAVFQLRLDGVADAKRVLKMRYHQ